MSTGIRKLAKIQFVPEVTPGTAVNTATNIWRGQGGMLEDQRKIEWIDELCGIFNGLDRTVTTQLLGALQLADTSLTAEQLQHLFVMGINGPTTGTVDTGGSGRIYVNTLPTNTFVTPKSYTWQGGDNFEAEVMEYGLVTKTTISGDINTYAKMGGLVMGRQVAYKGTGLTAVTIPVVGDYAVNNGKVYIDPVASAYGTTAVGGQILGFKVEYDFLWKPQFGMAGQLFYQQALYTGHSIKGSLTFIHDSSASGTVAAGQKIYWRTEAPLHIRIDLTGPALASAGALYTNKRILIDLVAKYVKGSPLTDKDGMDILTFDFDSRYNLTSAEGGKVTTVFETSPLV